MTFDDFWQAYPRKENKKGCKEIWDKAKLNEHASAIVYHLKKRVKDDQKWLDGFIPMPATFLRQERWNDEYVPKQVQRRTEAPKEAPDELPPQRDRFKAYLNTVILPIMQRHKGGPVTLIPEIIRMRDRFAEQMHAMWDEHPPDKQESQEILAGMRKQFEGLFNATTGTQVRREPAIDRGEAAGYTPPDSGDYEPRGERIRGHSGGVQGEEFPF